MIHHIAIWTNDLERQRVFYETYFGGQAGPKYTNTARGFESYFLTFKEGATLEIMTQNNLKSSEQSSMPSIGLAHMAFAVPTKDAVDTLTQRMRMAGIEVLKDPRTTGDGAYESELKDHDGNVIEIVALY